jgi:hypothetical protein
MKISIFEREIMVQPKVLNKFRYFDLPFSVYEAIYANLHQSIKITIEDKSISPFYLENVNFEFY